MVSSSKLPVSTGFYRWGRFLAGMLAATLLPAACMSAETGKTLKPAVTATETLGLDSHIEGKPIEPGSSFVGNYLAGRHAQAMRDGEKAIAYYRKALTEDPGNTDLMLRATVLMVSEGDFDRAVPLARRLATAGGENSVIDYVLAVDDVKEGRFAEAEKRLADLPENGINHYIGPLVRAWAQVGRKDVDGALATLAAMRTGKEANPLLDLHVALIDEVAGRTKDAGVAFGRAVGGEGGSAFRALQLYGAFLERTGQTGAARDLYKTFLANHPESPLMKPALARLDAGKSPPPDIVNAVDGVAQALFDLSGAFRQQNAKEMALVLGRLALALKPDFPVAQFLVADILEAMDRQESANQLYASIDRASPFSWTARIRVALNLNAMDRTDEAVAQLREMAAERPDDPETLITLGNILRGHEKFAEAVKAYDQAVARIGTLQKGDWSLLYSRGMALERSKQWKLAEADFLQALKFEPDQPYVLNYLGYSWVDKGMHLDRAMGMIKKAVKLRPNDGYIVDSLGWALYRLGDDKGAVRELERAVELRPEDPVINDHLGDAYWKVGRRQEARFQWRRSLGLDPEPDLVGAIEKKLKTGLTKGAAPGGDG